MRNRLQHLRELLLVAQVKLKNRQRLLVRAQQRRIMQKRTLKQLGVLLRQLRVKQRLREIMLYYLIAMLQLQLPMLNNLLKRLKRHKAKLKMLKVQPKRLRELRRPPKQMPLTQKMMLL